VAAVKSFKELVVWQKAMQLVRVVYDATDGFPKTERYALADQLVRAAVSVPSNIAGARLVVRGRDAVADSARSQVYSISRCVFGTGR